MIQGRLIIELLGHLISILYTNPLLVYLAHIRDIQNIFEFVDDGIAILTVDE